MAQQKKGSAPNTVNSTLWRRFDWNLIRVFYEIAEQGGVSAAAETLGRSQPAVSQALSRLEDHLGVMLCERGPAGFSLTPDGEIVFEQAAAIVTAMREIPDMLAQASGQVRDVLKLALMCDIADPELDEILAAVARRHPQLQIEIDVAPWQSVIAAVQAGDADAGICYLQVLDSTLAYEPAFYETQQLYCGAHHPLFGHRFNDPRQCAAESYFLTGRDEPAELAKFRLQFGLGRKVRGNSENLSELKRLIMTGTGIGFLPAGFAASDVRARALWPLLNYDGLPRYAVNVVTRPETARSLPASLFIQEARRRRIAREGGR